MDQTVSDSCGYPELWGTRGEERPTTLAENSPPARCENAVEAGKAEKTNRQPVSESPQSVAESVSATICAAVDVSDDWWNWI